MSYEAIIAFATVGQLIVIVVAALAAFRQIRHMKAANQWAGVMHVIEMYKSDQFYDALDYVENELPGKLKDAAYREKLQSETYSRRELPELFLCDLQEQIGSYVRLGFISPDHYFDIVPIGATIMWRLLKDVVAIQREKFGPTVYENFEYLVVRMRRYSKEHPQGNYPKGFPRLADELQEPR
ncbi:MAG: hypothetical protein ABSE64_14620 [Vulcanimicrobiaceae bacterium]